MQTTLRFQHDRICLEADTTGIGQIVITQCYSRVRTCRGVL